MSGVRNLISVPVTDLTLSLNCMECVLDCSASNSARPVSTTPATLTKRTSSATSELKALTSCRFHASSQRPCKSRMAVSSSAWVAESGLTASTRTVSANAIFIGSLRFLSFIAFPRFTERGSDHERRWPCCRGRMLGEHGGGLPPPVDLAQLDLPARHEAAE